MSGWYRLQAYRHGWGEDVDRLATQLEELVDTLATTLPALGDWHWEVPGTGERRPLAPLGEARRALTAGRVAWRTGEAAQTSFELRAVALRREVARAELRVVCGIWLPDLAPLSVPERLRLRIAPSLGDEAALRAALAAVVQTWAPDWAHAGDDDAPAAPLPLFSDGRPVVGWWTWFGPRFPRLPALAPPAAVVPLDGAAGTLVAAHPGLYRSGDRAQAAAIEALRAALRDAGALVPPPR